MEPCGGWGAGLPCPAQPRLASRPPPLRPGASAPPEEKPRPHTRAAALARGPPTGPADRVRRLRRPPGGYPCWSRAPPERCLEIRPYVIDPGRTLCAVPTLCPCLAPSPPSRTRAAERPADSGSRGHRLALSTCLA